MGIKLTGFEELSKKLGQLEKRTQDLEKTNKVSFDELFVSSFMRKYTDFSDFNEFLESGNFVVNSQEDFDAIPDSEMDSHVEKTTSFSSWEDMLGKATEEYIVKQLGFK